MNKDIHRTKDFIFQTEDICNDIKIECPHCTSVYGFNVLITFDYIDNDLCLIFQCKECGNKRKKYLK